MLLSAYAHFLVKSAGKAPLARFLTPKLQMQIPWPTIEYYCYSRLVEWYQNAFGKDRVLVLPMELVTRDEQAMLNRTCAFCDVAPLTHNGTTARRNARNYRQYAALRLFPPINSFGPRTPANGFGSIDFRLLHMLLLGTTSRLVPRPLENWIVERDRAKIETHLTDAVSVDNRALQKLIPDDLASFGYLT